MLLGIDDELFFLYNNLALYLYKRTVAGGKEK